MVRVIDIDPALMPRAHENFWLDLDDVGQIGLDGDQQILFTENRRWISRLDFVRMRPDAHRAAVVIGDQLRGRVNRLRLTLRNVGTPRFNGSVTQFNEKIGIADSDIAQGYLDYGDGTEFGDSTGFAVPDRSEPTLVYAAAIGADVVTLDGYLGRNLAISAFFSIADFLYRVESNDNGVIRFNPPLRQAALAGKTVRVSRPRIQVRLVTKSEWRPFCEYFRNGQPMTVNVVEAFDR